jgi:hypothetical protein
MWRRWGDVHRPLSSPELGAPAIRTSSRWSARTAIEGPSARAGPLPPGATSVIRASAAFLECLANGRSHPPRTSALPTATHMPPWRTCHYRMIGPTNIFSAIDETFGWAAMLGADQFAFVSHRDCFSARSQEPPSGSQTFIESRNRWRAPSPPSRRTAPGRGRRGH